MDRILPPHNEHPKYFVIMVRMPQGPRMWQKRSPQLGAVSAAHAWSHREGAFFKVVRKLVSIPLTRGVGDLCGTGIWPVVYHTQEIVFQVMGQIITTFQEGRKST